MSDASESVDPVLFWTKVDRQGPDECWLWNGDTDRYGYGEWRIKRQRQARYYRAHRLAYELAVGPIPEGLVIDHLCEVRACCNPGHLEPVTNRENLRRGAERRAVLDSGVLAVRTHCKWGHEYVDGSYYIRNGRYRICKACGRDRAMRWKERQRQAG